LLSTGSSLTRIPVRTLVYPSALQSLSKDVGVDDVLAMLLALAAKPEELEILLLSITYGNVEVKR
jgi:hypothetical protein